MSKKKSNQNNEKKLGEKNVSTMRTKLNVLWSMVVPAIIMNWSVRCQSADDAKEPKEWPMYTEGNDGIPAW